MKLSVPARKMVKYIALSTAVLVAGGVILSFAVPSLATEDQPAPLLALYISLGLILSSLTNVLKVFLLDRQVANLSAMDNPKKARYYASGQAVLRFLLTGGSLVAAHFIIFTNLYAAIAGAFTWHIAIYALKNKEIDLQEPVIQATPMQAGEDGKSDGETAETGDNEQ